VAGGDLARPPAALAMQPDPQLEARILALDPTRVSDDDVRKLLALGPTPRIVLLHGGIYPVHLVMESFARFLVGMGYPEAKLRHPGDGRRSHSPYENSAQITGLLGWYYENEAMMPLMIGHSQGGIQLVKVLYELSGKDGPVRVWNPLTDAAEERVLIVDPFTGAKRPVVGLKVGYASVVGAGGAALMLPNQWSMVRRLRAIPDTVDDFTGYMLALDLVAWDVAGADNDYRALGTAQVRNVELPVGYSHVFVPATSHLARDPAMRAWIDAYAPGRADAPPAESTLADNSLWAADVWYHVKKHWVLQAQQLLRARRASLAARSDAIATPREPRPLRQP
ncbi:MAG TPA: hypothetical protein PLO41_24865, partial [Rubrivivax sp.]|nr:hypothetical protein [Rubrivivax sp.]